MLKAQLRPLGYTAENEESLQIRRIGDAAWPRADILIADATPQRSASSAYPTVPEIEAMALGELVELDEERDYPYQAIAIFKIKPNLLPDRPVAWIELLSPSNKGGGIDARTYNVKRRELLQGGMVFVELDYLHETPPTFWRLPDYTSDEPNSHAYRVLVLDPRPDVIEGRAYRQEFDVDTPIPPLKIPLLDQDVLAFDLGLSYERLFAEAFYGDNVDYTQLPMHFERYSPTDQTHVVRRMLAILKAKQANADLETGPFPVEEITLEDGLSQLRAMV